MSGDAPHIPVLLGPVLEALAPVEGGVFVDGTFGAGGYTRALLEAGARRVIAIDRDPAAAAIAARLQAEAGERLIFRAGEFDRLDVLAHGAGEERLDGVVLDVGVSSIQLDEAARGFSFLRDGPLDMRMSGEGISAGDLVNRAGERELADILHGFGEERAARRIARAIVRARGEGPITGTLALAEIVAGVMPRQKPGQIHPATRSFQALRIAVNDELGQLVRALAAAERALKPGGRLAVVTFHSLEDRIVKRYLAVASGSEGQGSRHMPELERPAPRFSRPMKPVVPDEGEIAQNPRARSARLRAAARTEAPPVALPPAMLGVPAAPVAADLLAGGAR